MGDPWWTKYVLLGIGWFLGLLSKELSERITIWIRGPKLKVEFGSGDDCMTFTPEEFDVPVGPNAMAAMKGNRVVLYVRIRVTNCKPRIATRCQAWLVGVEQSDGQGGFKDTNFKDSIPLGWSYIGEVDAVDVPQGINRYIDLLRMQTDVPGCEPRLRSNSGDVLRPLRYQRLFRDDGTWRFTVLISAQDLKPQPVRIVVRRDGWPPTAEAAV